MDLFTVIGILHILCVAAEEPDTLKEILNEENYIYDNHMVLESRNKNQDSLWTSVKVEDQWQNNVNVAPIPIKHKNSNPDKCKLSALPGFVQSWLRNRESQHVLVSLGLDVFSTLIEEDGIITIFRMVSKYDTDMQEVVDFITTFRNCVETFKNMGTVGFDQPDDLAFNIDDLRYAYNTSADINKLHNEYTKNEISLKTAIGFFQQILGINSISREIRDTGYGSYGGGGYGSGYDSLLPFVILSAKAGLVGCLYLLGKWYMWSHAP